MNHLHRLLATSAPPATALIRLLVGSVFVSEGIQKFLFPAAVGAGRFTKIGLPVPDLLALLVGSVEIVCGLLLLLGLLTRLVTLPLITVMFFAVATTKLPILVKDGFWKMAHEARTDWSMLLGCLFLLIVGGGIWSLDYRLLSRTSLLKKAQNHDGRP